MRPLICSLILFLSITLDSVRPLDWTHYTVLDGDGRFHLYWKPPEDKHGNSIITFKVEIEAQGYFGLGFSPNGGMPGSDIVTGWIKDGEVYFQDRHAIDFSLPPKDEQQDYELIDAYEINNFTVFEFSRKLDTCDKNDMVINDNTMRVIYAYSEEDPETDDPFYHRENRGVKSALLLQSKNHEDVDLNLTELLTWDLLSPGIEISTSDSFYWCKIFKTPQVSEKHHIVYIQAAIEEAHIQFVHHLAVYECLGETPEAYEDFLDHDGHFCWHPTMPDEMLKCQGYTFAWALGGPDLMLPEQAGLPLEPGPGKYFMLEIHYDNPQLRTGIDHSGFRFYYTANLRQYDAGSQMIGSSVLPRAFIPPGREEYIMVGHSSPECAAWADNEIKILAVLPHSHLLGRKIKVRHFRGNQELTPLANDKNYDFNYQEYRFLTKEVSILPGDQITVECSFNSLERSNVTFGGLSTREEMCIGMILYYPLKNRYLSFSAPSFSNINSALGTNITSEAELTQVLGSYHWSNEAIDTIQNVMLYSEHEVICRFGEYPEEGLNPLVTYPSDIIPYKPETTCGDTV